MDGTSNEQAEEQMRDMELALTVLAYPELVQRAKELAELVREYQVERNPPATLQDISAFEQKYGVSLPEEYRYFLMFIGNGVKSLEGTSDIRPLGPTESSACWEYLWKTLEDVREPFSLTGGLSYASDDPEEEDEEEDEAEADTDEKDTRTGDRDCFDYYFEAQDRALAAMKCGTLFLCDDQDKTFVLVLNGPERGSVWGYESQEYGNGEWSLSFFPQAPFLDWFKEWLENDD